MADQLALNQQAPTFNLTNQSGENINLDSFAGKPLVLLFARYVGCPVCQMDTNEYKRHYDELKQAGVEVAMVFQSSTDILQQYATQETLPFTVLSDPKGKAYKQYGVEWGVTGFLSVKNISPIVKSIKSGYRHGKFEGNEFQYPAVFIIDGDKNIRFAHYGKTVSDSLSPSEVLSEIKRAL